MRMKVKLVMAAALLLSVSAQAQTARQAFPAKDGEAVFKSICQGCHMPDAKGAVGAGAYPALAANPNLAAGAFPIVMVINGRKAMPPLGGMLSDQQVAEVVNYLRTHFGNRYKDKVSIQDVKDIRALDMPR